MRSNTVEPRLNRKTGHVGYLVKVDGVSHGLFFTDEELAALSANIDTALGGTHDHKHN